MINFFWFLFTALPLLLGRGEGWGEESIALGWLRVRSRIIHALTLHAATVLLSATLSSSFEERAGVRSRVLHALHDPRPHIRPRMQPQLRQSRRIQMDFQNKSRSTGKKVRRLLGVTSKRERRNRQKHQKCWPCNHEFTRMNTNRFVFIGVHSWSIYFFLRLAMIKSQDHA